ncbi:MAG: PAS domain S-box protein [Bdellovibrionales bacterium]|nr:PAS domain S-box protein [Bdellovibrionales bacterium]
MWLFSILALGFLGWFFLYYQKRQSFQRNALFREIEELKKKYEVATQNLRMEEGELETVMSAISDAILAVDKEGRPIFFNTKFEMVFGQGKIPKFLRLREIFEDPQIVSAFEVALREGRNSSSHSFKFSPSNGQVRYFNLSVSPLSRSGLVIYGALGIFHDVTELKTAEQMRIDFVANVSHELRTPLTSIKGYTETLLADFQKDPESLKQESTEEFLEKIARNASRLMNLVGDLLDLSSIESNEAFHKELVLTEDIMSRISRTMEEKFKIKKQVLESMCFHKEVWADPNRLEQVLINLIDNAHKYTPEGGHVSVIWKVEGNEVILTVKDTGVGIPAEYHSRLFERFYRVDKARSRDQGGTGLGLSIVKHIMQKHEGTVSLESAPKKGATFICRFPVN